MMQTLLQKHFQIPSTTSQGIVAELVRREWVTWEDGQPGRWNVIEVVELADEAETKFYTTRSDSQAVQLIERARRLRATDIHLDPCESNERMIRLRIDGTLEEFCRISEEVGDHLANQLKTLAELNIAEPFLPQEGRVRLPPSMSELEVRITAAPVAAGDAIALRLFDGKNIFLPLESLGLSDTAFQNVNAMLRLREGLVLVTGPTGSGKTTTVYSMLESLGGTNTNAVSIEDPVEFAVPFVRQMSVDAKHGVTMTNGLRTLLRMDPDVVFLGEIRDVEAAHIAMRAASSGKYVLSTLHTRDVASTITALRDMEISDRSSAGNLTGIINQRLLRRLCPNCKKPVSPTNDQKKQFAIANVSAPNEVFEPGGCELCRRTGFRGRVGAFEVAIIDENLANAIAGGDSEAHVKKLMRSGGVASLMTDALIKVANGIACMDDALSVHWLS